LPDHFNLVKPFAVVARNFGDREESGFLGSIEQTKSATIYSGRRSTVQRTGTSMAASIHARLDDETEALRDQIRRATEWTNSEIVRRGIALLASTVLRTSERRFSGAGEYDTGIPDLSTNKAYMEGFGES
jgi:hypothetical protein